ncbi:MAG TPA: YbaK/EbsC family protein [Myxococcales bacterium]|jgi:Ala-tRNA(Pro) deacylase
MIPKSIIDYLDDRAIPFRRVPHTRAVSAQQLAHSMHITGYRVAKAVIADCDGQWWIAVLPAAEMLDLAALAATVGSATARLVSEDEFGSRFAGCELGAEPPFGKLFGLPVIADRSLIEDETVLFRAGSHEEALEMTFEDFTRLEGPLIASIGFMPMRGARGVGAELRT